MRLVSFAILALMFSSGAALACSCADVTPRSCNLLANRDESIFAGTVVSVENPPKEGDKRGGMARYHFRVEERLSPDVRGEVEVLSGRGGADCSFWFETGIPYLVFAYRGDNDELRASVCSNTRRVVDAGPLLAQLRAMHNGQSVGSGLRYGPASTTAIRWTPTSQISTSRCHKCCFISSHRRERKSRKTADDGSFAVYELPSGTTRSLPICQPTWSLLKPF